MKGEQRNLAERIKAIKEGGDGYMTVMTKVETEKLLSGCSNLSPDGKCKINPILPEIMGCGRGTMCGFYETYHAE